MQTHASGVCLCTHRRPLRGCRPGALVRPGCDNGESLPEMRRRGLARAAGLLFLFVTIAELVLAVCGRQCPPRISRHLVDHGVSLALSLVADGHDDHGACPCHQLSGTVQHQGGAATTPPERCARGSRTIRVWFQSYLAFLCVSGLLMLSMHPVRAVCRRLSTAPKALVESFGLARVRAVRRWVSESRKALLESFGRARVRAVCRGVPESRKALVEPVGRARVRAVCRWVPCQGTSQLESQRCARIRTVCRRLR